MQTLGDREQERGHVALAFGTHRPTSTLRSKRWRVPDAALASLYVAYTGSIFFITYLKTFKNLENL